VSSSLLKIISVQQHSNNTVTSLGLARELVSAIQSVYEFAKKNIADDMLSREKVNGQLGKGLGPPCQAARWSFRVVSLRYILFSNVTRRLA
jgi:hypothetical protein